MLRWTLPNERGGHLTVWVLYRTGHFESLFGCPIQRCMVRDCPVSSVIVFGPFFECCVKCDHVCDDCDDCDTVTVTVTRSEGFFLFLQKGEGCALNSL